MKKIKTNFEGKAGKNKHWAFGFLDTSDDVFPPVINRNEVIEIETDNWDAPVQAVKLSNFRALAVVDENGGGKHYEQVQTWPGLYVALAGSGITHLTLEIDAENQEFLPGGAKQHEHRLIDFTAEIFMADGTTIEVDPIIDERPT